MPPQIAPGPWRGWNSVLLLQRKWALRLDRPVSSYPQKALSTSDSAGQGRRISQVRWSGESAGREKGKLATPAFETIHSFKECKKGCIYKNTQICCCCCSVTRLCLILCNPTDCSTPGFPVLHHLPEFAQTHVMSIESMMSSNHLILCHPFLLLPWTFPSIRVFFNESVLRMRWPEHGSFSFSISPPNEYSGLISFRIDWFDLFAVQGTLKNLLQICSCMIFFPQSYLWISMTV